MRVLHKFLNFTAVIASIFVMTASTSAVGSATLSMSPSSTSVTTGDNLNVSIYENGTNVSVVTINMSYDSTKLNCTNVNVASSAFANAISATCASGIATISRYIAPGSTGLNGSQLVGTLQFTATAEGTAQLALDQIHR